MFNLAALYRAIFKIDCHRGVNLVWKPWVLILKLGVSWILVCT